MFIFVGQYADSMEDYLDILREWQVNVLRPFVYEHLDTLFPDFGFIRKSTDNPSRDHWASRRKMDLSIPRMKNAEKTVIYRSSMFFHEQGDWEASAKGILDFYMDREGFPDIFSCCRALSERFSLNMPLPEGKEVEMRVQERKRRESVLDDLLDYFAWNLEHNVSQKADSVRRYLQKERGFTMEEASCLNLGFVPDWGKVMRHIVTVKKHSLEDLEAACEVRNSDGKTSVGKTHTLAIPYECAGVLKGFLFRRIGEGTGPKYMASQNLDRKSVFFHITADPDPKDIIVVEGEFDALKAEAAGIPNVVAIGGSEIAGERRSQVEDALGKRGVRKITLCLDLDAEKDNPAVAKTDEQYSHILRSIHTIKDVNLSFEEIYVATFPSPSDPDEFIRSRGAEAFKDLIENARPYWRYLSDYNSNK